MNKVSNQSVIYNNLEKELLITKPFAKERIIEYISNFCMNKLVFHWELLASRRKITVFILDLK